jgi:endoribonuclease LACTB2
LYEINSATSSLFAKLFCAKVSMHSTDDPPTSSIDILYHLARQHMPQDVIAQSSQTIEIIPLTNWLRRIELRTPTLPPATHTACYVVGPTTEAGEFFLVDPGSPYPDQQNALDQWLDSEHEAGRKLAAVLLTHHHADHIGGVAHLVGRGIEIWAHELTATHVAHRFAVARKLRDGERLTLGNCHVDVMWTPGHAVGHLCFGLPDDEVIAGDMVAGIGTILIDADEGNMTDYLASLARLENMQPTRLHPAHGPTITNAVATLQHYAAHRRHREVQVVQALRTHAQSVDQLVAVVYHDTPKMLWPLAARSLLAHLRKLNVEGRAHVDDKLGWRS